MSEKGKVTSLGEHRLNKLHADLLAQHRRIFEETDRLLSRINAFDDVALDATDKAELENMRANVTRVREAANALFDRAATRLDDLATSIDKLAKLERPSLASRQLD